MINQNELIGILFLILREAIRISNVNIKGAYFDKNTNTFIFHLTSNIPSNLQIILTNLIQHYNSNLNLQIIVV